MLIPIPSDSPDEPYEPIQYQVVDKDSVAKALGLPSWKCPKCNLVNNFHNKYCADKKCAHIKI